VLAVQFLTLRRKITTTSQAWSNCSTTISGYYQSLQVCSPKPLRAPQMGSPPLRTLLKLSMLTGCIFMANLVNEGLRGKIAVPTTGLVYGPLPLSSVPVQLFLLRCMPLFFGEAPVMGRSP